MYRLFVFCLVFLFAVWAGQSTFWPLPNFQYGDLFKLDTFLQPVRENPIKSLVFTGDVLLARNVERLSLANGYDYPFQNIVFASSSAVLINFEAVVPEVHKPTKDFNFAFSVPTSSLPSLVKAGVTHATLANNHSYDFGVAGLINTKNELSKLGISTLGDQINSTSTSLEIIEVGEEKIAVIAIYAVEEEPSAVDLDAIFAAAENYDKQIVFIHWGTEYETEPSNFQINLAKNLVERGTDLIVGHHPHVVQSIGLIDKVPVIYSLGNFVFDQYFSEAVQTGMLLEYVKTDVSDYLRLVPITSLDSRSSPRYMDVTEKTVFLEKLAASSDQNLRSEIAAGTINLSKE